MKNTDFLKEDSAELSFSIIIDSILLKAKKKNKKIFSNLENKDHINVVDVGSGYFRYGKVLYNLLSSLNDNLNLYAVDHKKKRFSYKPAKYVKADINNIHKVVDIKNIDIFTVFNPYPRIPKFSNIPHKIKKNSILLGCVDWNQELFHDSLVLNNFEPQFYIENPYKEEMEPWFNTYDPFVFAVYSGKK